MSIKDTPPKDLSYYLRLKYRVTLHERKSGRFFVFHPDLDGCMAEGDSAQEALENLADARELWIETRLSGGYSVPEPASDRSGKFSIRTSPSFHGTLAERAEREGVSLNQYVNNLFAEHIGGDQVSSYIRRRIDEAVSQLTAPLQWMLSDRSQAPRRSPIDTSIASPQQGFGAPFGDLSQGLLQKGSVGH